MKVLLLLFLPISLFAQQSNRNKNGSATATALINSFSAAQKEKAVLTLEDTSRYKWHFVPASMSARNGISIKDFDKKQKEYFYSLLKMYLSAEGYKRTTDIMNLEYVLKVMEPENTNRIPENYFLSFYGNPGKDSSWAWKFTGHHLALNFTIINNKLAFAPFFFGSNPGEIKEGPSKGSRIIIAEEDLGFQLVNSLSPQQKQKAIFELRAFNDIVTANATAVTPLKPVGIVTSELNSSQKEILNQLIGSYLSSMPEDVAKKRFEKLTKEDFAAIRFGWAGDTVPGKPHYYRIQGVSFLIEFDNTQNNANHIHEVWRDFNGDYGLDLLKEHYQNFKNHLKN